MALLLFAALFTIHWPIWPLAAETQPLLPLLLSMVVLALGWRRLLHDQTLRRWSVVLALVVLLLLLHGLLQLSPRTPLDLAKYLLGPIFFLAALLLLSEPADSLRSFAPVALAALSLAFALGTLLLYLWPGLVGLWPFEWLVPTRAHLSFWGGRGVSPFTPEPSYLFFFVAWALWLVEWLWQDRLALAERLQLWFARLVWLALALLTFSFYPLVLIAIYLLALLFRSLSWQKALPLALLVPFFLVALILQTPAWERIAPGALFAPGTALERVERFSASGSVRIWIATVAIAAPFTPGGSLLGYGAGTFPEHLIDHADRLGIDLDRSRAMSSWFAQGGRIKAQSYFQALIHDTGLLGLMLALALIFWMARSTILQLNAGGPLWLPLYLVPLVLLIFFYQGQITQPLPWLLLAFLFRNGR